MQGFKQSKERNWESWSEGELTQMASKEKRWLKEEDDGVEWS